MKRPQRAMTDRSEGENGPGDPENGLTLLQVVPKSLHPLERDRLLDGLRPVWDLLLGLLGGPLVKLVQPLLAQGIDLLLGQVRQEDVHHVDVGRLRPVLHLRLLGPLLSTLVDEELDPFGRPALPFDVVGEVDVGLLFDLLLSLLDDVMLQVRKVLI